MATRLYLPSSGTAGATPAPDAIWDNTTGHVYRPMSTTKSDTALTDETRTWTSTSTHDRVWVSFVSDPLDSDQTISGTFAFVARFQEQATNTDASPNWGLKVVSGDGSTVRGVLRAFVVTMGEMSTTAQTKHNSGVALTSVNALAGDRIVFELGANGLTPSLTWSLVRLGDPVGVEDFAYTPGLTTDLCPSIEFSQDITFDAGASSVTFVGTGVTDTAYGSGLLKSNTTFAGTGIEASVYGTGSLFENIVMVGSGIDQSAYGDGILKGTITMVGTGIDESAYGSGALVENIVMAGTGIDQSAVGSGLLTSTTYFVGTGIDQSAYGDGVLEEGTTDITFVGSGIDESAYGLGVLNNQIAFVGTGIDQSAYGAGTIVENITLVGVGVDGSAYGLGSILENITLVGTGINESAYGIGELQFTIPSVTFEGTGFNDTAYGSGSLLAHVVMVGTGIDESAYGFGALTGTGVPDAAFKGNFYYIF